MNVVRYVTILESRLWLMIELKVLKFLKIFFTLLKFFVFFFLLKKKGTNNITTTISTHAHLYSVSRVPTVDSIHEACSMVVQDVTMV